MSVSIVNEDEKNEKKSQFNCAEDENCRRIKRLSYHVKRYKLSFIGEAEIKRGLISGFYSILQTTSTTGEVKSRQPPKLLQYFSSTDH